jgi:predicted amidophosphoribosyltransferase
MADDALWTKTDHVCRVCFGRVLRRPHFDGGTIVQCADCGLEAVGTHRAICCCGIKRGPFEKLRCVRQDKPSPEFPLEVVAVEVS